MAIGTQRHTHGHQFLFDFLIRCQRQHMRNEYGQSTWRGVPLICHILGDQFFLDEAGIDARREDLAKTRECLRRQFFGEQLDEQRGGGGVRHHAASCFGAPHIGNPSASRLS